MKIITGTTQIFGLIKSTEKVKMDDERLKGHINDWFMVDSELKIMNLCKASNISKTKCKEFLRRLS